MENIKKNARAKPMADGAKTIFGDGGDGLRSRQRNSLTGGQSVALRASAGSRKAANFVRNPFGIRIKVCCASCQWKQLTASLVKRKCRRWNKKVTPRQCCRLWGMRAELKELKIRNKE